MGRRADHTYLVGAALTDAETRGEELTIRYPIENGRVEDWDALKALWYVRRTSHTGTTSSRSSRCTPHTTPSLR